MSSGGSKKLKKRFRVVIQPTILFFRRGQQYLFEGELDLDQLYQFGSAEYINAREQGPILKEPSGMSAFWSGLVETLDGRGDALDAFLIKDDKDNINHMAMVVVIGVPIIMLFCVCYVIIDNEVPYQQSKAKVGVDEAKDKKKEKIN